MNSNWYLKFIVFHTEKENKMDLSIFLKCLLRVCFISLMNEFLSILDVHILYFGSLSSYLPQQE